MARKWRYLIFPEKNGALALPALTMRIFDPTTGRRRDLGCRLPPIDATLASAPSASETPAPVRRDEVKRRALPWISGAILVALLVGVAGPRLKRELRLRREIRAITSGTPTEIRERIDARVGDPAMLLAEHSERGDAYRALRSLLDAATRERDIADGADEEIARRVRDVLVAQS
jgi:hypothetical protein